MSKKDHWFYTFIRHQIAGFIATLGDFVVFNLLTYAIGIYYLTSNIFAAITGAVVNFIISTYWAFPGSKNSLKNQILKYVIVSIGSLILNTFTLYILTDFFKLPPNVSKIITAIAIALTYNFLLMRYFVFKK
ncbi:MAG: GtrA family protein [Flavobacteriales bacterium]|nr:GtrA family protein [Flavobacteriales bacterium]